ncbi:MAG: GtrA family protein [Chitinophagaceae bacterium]|nr:GtrA family protein [Chitinophagaceae bacterium]MBL0056356.1 GtrA family protein [Chitinophagaceae bacterium]
MPEQTFRYAVCGGTNTVLGLAIYFISYQYVLHKANLDLGFFAFKPHIAALFISFCINFVVGFLLMKFVVFVDSNLRGRIQLFRYFLSFSFNLVLNYVLLKLFVEVLFMPVLISQFITTCIVVTVSYLSQKHFSFKVKPDGD